MRVVQVTDYGSPFAGSFEPMLRAALTATRARGWEPLAVLPPRARERPWTPALLRDHPGEVVFYPEGGRRELTRWLEELVDQAPGPTLLHAHWHVFDLPAADLARRRPDIRTIWHFHTVLAGGLKVRLRNRLRFIVAARWVTRILCVAPHLVSGIVARGAPAERVEYFPNGIDVDRFPGPASAEERAKAREALGLDPGATVLLHIGRDWHLKGGDLLLDAIERLDDQDVVVLLIRGGEVAEAEVARRGLGDRARVMEGTPEVRRLHAACDAMVASSRGEGMPFAVVEALASGLGVVATDIPGHSLPGGGPVGLETVALDAAALAGGITRVLARDAETRREQGRASHEWVRRELGLDAWSERLMAVYERATGDWN